jgi:histidinol-phosphatase (PHP family)
VILTNYHSHSHYCDGKGSLEEQVQGAIAQGLSAFGFSSHCPLPFDNQWSMKAERLPQYLAETQQLVEKYKHQIQLYIGLEIDFLPDMPAHPPWEGKLDFALGSVHYCGLNQLGQPWEIDGSSGAFLTCLDALYGGDIQLVIKKYYALIRQMVTTMKPDIVGHLDKIKIHNAARSLFAETESWYVEEVEHTLGVIAQAGLMVELNTRGIYKKGLELYPSPWIVRQMHELGIPICINSDSHRPEEITASFDYAHACARAAGYQTKRVLLSHHWQEVSL